MNIEEGNKKIAITICSGICVGEELLKHDPEIKGIETLVGYDTIEKTREEQQHDVRMNNIIAEEDEPII